MSQTHDHDAARDARLTNIASLGGEVALDGILRRFAAHLATLMEQAEWSAADAHRIVGLAGMLGFSEVENAWKRIEDDDTSITQRTAARDTALAAMDFIARRPPPPHLEP